MNKLLYNLRAKHGYTQEELAKLIGVSRQTYAQIEKGSSELTVSQASKLADVFGYSSIDDFIAGKAIPKTKLVIAEEKTSEKNIPTKKIKQPEIRISVPRENIKKFKEVLLYILEKIGAKTNVGESVICKLLYFIDFDYYEKYEEQLIGAKYIKNHHGPTPAGFIEIIAEMEQKHELVRVDKKYFKYQQKKYLPLRKPTLEILSAREIEHIDWVLARLSNKNAKEMEEYSHHDVPWITAEDFAVLDYEAVFYRTCEFSVREYEDGV